MFFFVANWFDRIRLNLSVVQAGRFKAAAGLFSEVAGGWTWVRSWLAWKKRSLKRFASASLATLLNKQKALNVSKCLLTKLPT